MLCGRVKPGVMITVSTAISSITLAELAAGPHATDDRDERAKRQDRLQWATATWDAIPFDDEGARPVCLLLDLFLDARRLVGERLLPVAQLLAVDETSALYNEGERRSIFYAESWALTHYLLMERPSGNAIPVASSALEVTSTKTGFWLWAKLPVETK